MSEKHSLIVGGTRGSGLALVKSMAGNGRRVSVIGRRSPSSNDWDSETVKFWTVDVRDEAALAQTLPKIISESGKLSNLVFFQRYRGDGDSWHGEVETSLTATKNIIEQLAGDFDEGSLGSIVIISSIIGQFITAEQPLSYHVAKAGLNQMVRYFAVLLGPKKIRVNGISSGTIIKDESREFYLKNDRMCKLCKSITPLGRMGVSEDIVRVVDFLCGPGASFITGQNIVVDGGLSLQWQETLAKELVNT